MKAFAADLHVHTALSPCADPEMTPPAIVSQAINKGLDIVAICDHNTAGNAAAVMTAAGDNLTVFAGIEMTTAEEIHVLALFPDADAASRAGRTILDDLPNGADRSDTFGSQRLMESRGNTIGKESRLLSSAWRLSLDDAVDFAHAHGALAIASHVDRPSFSVTSQLGIWPEKTHFDAIEISPVGVRAGRSQDFAHLGFPVLAASDSHFLDDLGSCHTVFHMHDATFEELALALAGASGRSCSIA